MSSSRQSEMQTVPTVGIENVMDDKLANLSFNLTFYQMDATHEFPLNFES